MKRRGSLALLVVLTGFAAGLPAPASAQQPPPQPPAQSPDDAITEVARQRYNEGVKAFDAGKWEEARSAFLQAYALKRHPAVLLNIGLSELKSNHPEDAGNHFEQFLHDFQAATPDQKATAEKGIADAKKKTAFISITVDATGADVSIDGTLVGKSPVQDAVFVKPGKHTVVAQLQTKTATAAVDAKLGVGATASLALGVTSPPAPPVPPPAPTPAPPPVDTSFNNNPPPPMNTAPPLAPIPSNMPPDETTSTREPFFKWYTSHPLAIVGTGVAVIGLIGGIAFAASAGKASDNTNVDADTIRQYAATHPATDPGGRAPCGSQDSSGSDLAGYGKACDALRSDLSAYHTDVALATTGWILFGAGVVGTTAYALVDWFPKKKQAASTTPHVAVAPLVAPSARGLTVAGKF